MYRALGLLHPETTFDLDRAAAEIAARLPNHAITRDGDRVTVSSGDWSIDLALASGPDIRSETEGLVGKLAGIEPAEAESYVAAGRRIEVGSDSPDPALEHFNDYLQLIEVLKSFRGVLVVDPKEPGVL